MTRPPPNARRGSAFSLLRLLLSFEPLALGLFARLTYGVGQHVAVDARELRLRPFERLGGGAVLLDELEELFCFLLTLGERLMFPSA